MQLRQKCTSSQESRRAWSSASKSVMTGERPGSAGGYRDLLISQKCDTLEWGEPACHPLLRDVTGWV